MPRKKKSESQPNQPSQESQEPSLFLGDKVVSTVTGEVIRDAHEQPPVSVEAGTPAAPAEEPVKKKAWSYTQLSKFDICPSSYKKVYIEHMPSPMVPGALYGVLLHDYAAELLSKKANLPHEQKSVAQLIHDEGEVDWTTESMDSMLTRVNAVREQLVNFDFGYMPKLIEQHFTVDARGESFMGIGDVVTDDNIIVDHKFVTKKHASRSPMQIGLYSLAFEGVKEGKYEELYLSRGKLEVNMIDVKPFDLAIGKEMVFSLVDAIKKATEKNEFPHVYSWACKNCPFRDRCADEVLDGEPFVDKTY